MKIEDLIRSAPNLVRLLERGRDDLPAHLRATAWAGAQRDLRRIKREWQREASAETSRGSAPQDGAA